MSLLWLSTEIFFDGLKKLKIFKCNNNILFIRP